MKKALMIELAAIILGLFTAFPASADQASGSIRVSVIVQEYISLNTQSQAQTLRVTPDDIAKGYVDVNTGTVFTIKTNSRDGYMLYFENTGSQFSKVVLRVSGREIELLGMGGIVHQPYTGPQAIELSYRFYLSADVKPGTYQWPLRMHTDIY